MGVVGSYRLPVALPVGAEGEGGGGGCLEGVAATEDEERGDMKPASMPNDEEEELCTGACQYNRPCAHQYVGKYQACMV